MSNKLLGITLVVALVSALFSGFVVFNQPETPVVPSAEEIAAKVNVSLPVAEVNLSKLDKLYDDYFEAQFDEERMNITAKDISLAELGKKDFKKDVLSLLNDNNQSVEDYKDIEVYSSKIVNVELDGDEATVEIEFKVKSFNDGDDEDSFKAKLSGLFEVSNLDKDSEDESEVEDYELSLLKFYD